MKFCIVNNVLGQIEKIIDLFGCMNTSCPIEKTGFASSIILCMIHFTEQKEKKVNRKQLVGKKNYNFLYHD